MQTPSNNPSDQNLFLTNCQDLHLPSTWRIGLLISVLVIGVLLYHSFPLPVWLVVVHVLLKEAPAPAHFLLLLLFSFIIFISWILLLFVALQVLLPIRIRDHSQEESLASPPLVSQIASSPMAQHLRAIPLVQGSKVLQEAEGSKNTFIAWQAQTSWNAAEWPPETHQTFAKPWTWQEQIGQKEPFSRQNQQEMYQEARNVSPPATMDQDTSSRRVLQGSEAVMQEQQESRRKTMGTAGSDQLKSSPDYRAKAPLETCHRLWLYQGSSQGNASPVMFQIHPANLRGTNQHGVSLNGWSLCHPGIQRRQQPLEDYLLVAGELRLQITPPVPFTLFILADGHLVSSEDAQAVPNVSLSRLSAHWLSEILLPALCSSDPLEPQTVLHLLTEGMQQANRHLYQEYQREQTSQIVTMTVLLIVGMQAYTANVGDNRAYVYRPKSHRQATDEGLFQITTDHSPVSTQLERGVLTPKDLFQLPKVDHVYRALGQHARLSTVDIFSMTLKAGDFLLLCSDGLWKNVREATFLHIVEHLLEPPIASPALLCPSLVQTALEAGGYDHTSIMLAQVLHP